MSKDTVKINLKAEIKNIGEIEKQIEELQNQLNNMKINLIVANDKIDEDNELTLQEVIELKIDQAIIGVKNSPIYTDDGVGCKQTTLVLMELVNMLLRVNNGRIDIGIATRINDIIDYKANMINNTNKINNYRINENLMAALNNLTYIKGYINNCEII